MLRRGFRYARRIARNGRAVVSVLGSRGAIYFFFLSPFRELLAKSIRTPYAIPLKSGQRAWIRPGTSDRMVFDQIFVTREYAPLLSLSDVRQVVDLGANCGLASLWFLTHFPECSVIFVEPDQSNFVAACRNTAPYGTRCRGLRQAIWSESRRLNLHPAPNAQQGEWGLFVSDDQRGAIDLVEASTLEAVLVSENIQRIDILKVDIEGAETELIKTHTNWLPAVRALAIEIHGREAAEQIDRALNLAEWTRTTSGELTLFQRKTKS